MDYNKEFNINIKSSTPVITLTGTYTDDTEFNEIFTNETDAKTFISTNKSTLKTIKVDEPTGIFTDCSNIFANCISVTSIDLFSFNTSNVSTMKSMFAFCIEMTYIDISALDTSNVTNMQAMFSSCSKLTSLDLSSFDISNVNSMQSIVYGCNSITTAYGRTQEDCDILNASSGKPSNVNFVVKS